MIVTDKIEDIIQYLKINQPIISLDYGTKRSGVAISTRNWKIAMPLCTIITSNRKEIIKKIVMIINEKNACALVIGLPLGLAGENTIQTKIVLGLARKFSTILSIPIMLQDERYTSYAADEIMKLNPYKKNNKFNDHIAASIILENMLTKIQKLDQ